VTAQEIRLVPARSLVLGKYQPMPDLGEDEAAAFLDDLSERENADRARDEAGQGRLHNVVQVPIDVIEEDGVLVVLDGHNRARLGAELSIMVPVRIVDLGTEDPFDYALRVNTTRRHLTQQQKRDLIVRVLQHDRDRNAADPSFIPRSDRVIARLCGCSPTTVGEAGSQLIATVQSGQLSDQPKQGSDGKVRTSRATTHGDQRERKPSAKDRTIQQQAAHISRLNEENSHLKHDNQRFRQESLERAQAAMPRTAPPGHEHAWRPARACGGCGAVEIADDVSGDELLQQRITELEDYKARVLRWVEDYHQGNGSLRDLAQRLCGLQPVTQELQQSAV
jgi:hypothetical protein